jgi:iron-sulfur cluster repair protein YtfE (RIC family)
MTSAALEHLWQEHQQMLALLDAGDLAGLAALLALHVRKEEQVLFPFLERHYPRDSGPLAVLHDEHESLCAKMNPQLLRDHIRKEDTLLFPIVARLLSPEDDARLLRELEATATGLH